MNFPFRAIFLFMAFAFRAIFCLFLFFVTFIAHGATRAITAAGRFPRPFVFYKLYYNRRNGRRQKRAYNNGTDIVYNPIEHKINSFALRYYNYNPFFSPRKLFFHRANYFFTTRRYFVAPYTAISLYPPATPSRYPRTHRHHVTLGHTVITLSSDTPSSRYPRTQKKSPVA